MTEGAELRLLGIPMPHRSTGVRKPAACVPLRLSAAVTAMMRAAQTADLHSRGSR